MAVDGVGAGRPSACLDTGAEAALEQHQATGSPLHDGRISDTIGELQYMDQGLRVRQVLDLHMY